MSEPWYCTLDLETTIKNDIGNNKGSAFHPSNFIVLGGFSWGDGVRFSKHNTAPLVNLAIIDPKDKQTNLLIGHNIKFDIHHLRRRGAYFISNTSLSIEDVLKNGSIWDTQIVEYLLSGQSTKMVGLNELAPIYGGTTKVDEVKELWNAGVQTEDIDVDLLKEYLEGDVLNTELIAMQQMEEAERRGMLPLIQSQMDAALAVQEMEYNGMAIDLSLLETLRERHTQTLKELEAWCAEYLSEEYPEVPIEEWNIGSNKQLSAILFGGEIKWKRKELVGKYKNGKDKYKLVEHIHLLPGWHIPNPEWATKNDGVYSVSDTVLDELGYSHSYLLDAVKQYRLVKKELSTYIEGLGKLLFPDGLIHHNLNQCLTSTGRLSSSNPNLQNLPSGSDSEIKRLFISRWGYEGVIVEADYKQLEVIALAFLSRDYQLIRDITDGKDMHFETGKEVFGWTTPDDMTKDSRRIVKTINFGLIYGGGAKALAAQAKTTVDVAKKCIDAFYNRYPGVAEWQESNIQLVKESRTVTTDHTAGGMPQGVGYLQSDTGRVYKFVEYDAPEWMRHKGTDTAFSPTEIKNYPVQGFATGDIVPLVMGQLWRKLMHNDVLKSKCLMINQVHDALLFDVHIDVIEEAVAWIKEVMESAPQMLKETFDIDFDMPLKVDVSVGYNWKEQKSVDII